MEGEERRCDETSSFVPKLIDTLASLQVHSVGLLLVLGPFKVDPHNAFFFANHVMSFCLISLG